MGRKASLSWVDLKRYLTADENERKRNAGKSAPLFKSEVSKGEAFKSEL
jgi:hypothetical protein